MIPLGHKATQRDISRPTGNCSCVCNAFVCRRYARHAFCVFLLKKNTYGFKVLVAITYVARPITTTFAASPSLRRWITVVLYNVPPQQVFVPKGPRTILVMAHTKSCRPRPFRSSRVPIGMNTLRQLTKQCNMWMP